MNETQAREAICAIGASIFARGLTAGSSGNISVRLADGYLMTPTGAALGRLDPARLAKLDADGRPVAGPAPTKESFLHRVMYEERPGAGAVVHLHSTHAVAVSCLAEIDPADVLPANHGPVVAGTSLEAAADAIEELEETAKLYLLLRGAKTRWLTPAQVRELRG